jgi:hypothetical protein
MDVVFVNEVLKKGGVMSESKDGRLDLVVVEDVVDSHEVFEGHDEEVDLEVGNLVSVGEALVGAVQDARVHPARIFWNAEEVVLVNECFDLVDVAEGVDLEGVAGVG